MTEFQDVNYWLKPIGTADDNKKCFKNKDFEAFVQMCFEMNECQFKHKTEQIKKGDILICYLSGLQQIIFVSEITEAKNNFKYSEAERRKNPAKKRWPYYAKVKGIESKGLLLSKNIYLRDLKKNYFNDTESERFLSLKKDKDFKRIRQRDRLQLDPDFAAFVLNEIKK